MLHSALWKDKDLCNLLELNRPSKSCQVAFCRSQVVIAAYCLLLLGCWECLSAPLCACWYVLAFAVELWLCFGPVIYFRPSKVRVHLRWMMTSSLFFFFNLSNPSRLPLRIYSIFYVHIGNLTRVFIKYQSCGGICGKLWFYLSLNLSRQCVCEASRWVKYMSSKNK